MTTVDIVADLRGTARDIAADIIRRWASEDPSAKLIDRATFVVDPDATSLAGPLPTGWRVVGDPIPRGLWDALLTAAGRESRPVLALLAPIPPGLEAAGVMLDLLGADAMFGAVAAREQCWRGCCVRTLSSATTAPEWMPHAGVAELRAYEVLGDLLAPCMVFNPILLADFGDTDPPFLSLAGTLFHRVASARRCGFRTAVANRALIRLHDTDCARPPESRVSLPPADAERLRPFETDIGRERAEYRGASSVLFERLTSRHLHTISGAHGPSLLLDMRNVGAMYNGTAFAAIGAACGLHQAGTDWDVAILANPDGAAFHAFESVFPGWTVFTAQPPSGFNVAIRLSQPWHIQEMIDLHHAARLNAYLMLDTIAWDALYMAPPHLDGTWQFLASSADGFLFISDFSRQRFLERFPAARRTTHAVCHLSFDPKDYTRAELVDAPADNYILVIGNQFDHKDVAATVEALATAFPFLRLEVLGPSPVRSPRVTAHPSGNLAEADVHRLYARARFAVFPSFYEGFGLPVVTALSYGRTLLARESSLLEEVAARCPPGGRLIAYRQRNELVDLVGRLLHGAAVAERPIGAALNGGNPRSWLDVGRDLDRFMRELMAGADTPTWRARDGMVRQARAYRT